MNEGKRTCCYMETSSACRQPAKWEIECGPNPNNAVDACDLHVWKLITDAPTHWVGSLDSGVAFTIEREERTTSLGMKGESECVR